MAQQDSEMTQAQVALLLSSEMKNAAKLKREEIMSHQAPQGQTMNSQSSSDQNSSYTSQATTFIQQTGEQMMHMAQGAASAVKNTLGMNSGDNASNASNPNPTANPMDMSNAPSTNHPSNPSPRT
ncbi:hypothetical protein PTKIN_Ptkin13bG0132600 [Pterospermum kingtungense]